MSDKKTTIMRGVLMYPIRIGESALIYHRGQFIRTSTVVAIHHDAPDSMRFETLNTYYTLLLGPAPQEAACPTMLMPAAA